jgi:hypothetical protein
MVLSCAVRLAVVLGLHLSADRSADQSAAKGLDTKSAPIYYNLQSDADLLYMVCRRCQKKHDIATLLSRGSRKDLSHVLVKPT